MGAVLKPSVSYPYLARSNGSFSGTLRRNGNHKSAKIMDDRQRASRRIGDWIRLRACRYRFYDLCDVSINLSLSKSANISL